LRIAAGYFVPWDRDFSDLFFGDETEFNLDNPFYSIHYYPGSHRYYRFYWKFQYFQKESLNGDFRRIIAAGGTIGILIPPSIPIQQII
ncbi:MAG: hypothetical protein ACE5QV_07145, partial [Fidelibacterota bacterium]